MPYVDYTLGTSAENEAGAGVDWSNPTYALTRNSQRATVGFTGDGQSSDYLVVSTFGFDVSDQATIAGIEVELYLMQNQGGAPGFLSDVQLRDSTGDNTGLDYNDTAFVSNETLTLGGSSQLWTPTRAWTPTEINAATFAVAVKVKAASSGTTLQTVGLGSVRVRVWYTVPGGSSIGIGGLGIGL